MEAEDDGVHMWEVGLHLNRGVDPAKLARYMCALIVDNRYAGSDVFSPKDAQSLESIRLNPFPVLSDDGTVQTVKPPGNWPRPHGLHTAPTAPARPAVAPLPSDRISDSATRHF